VSSLVEKEIVQIVPPHESPVRVDVYVARQPLGLSRSQVRRLAEEGHLTVNRRPADPSRKVHPGDRIVVLIPPPKTLKTHPEAIPLTILYQDKHLAVIDKPAHLMVHAAGGRDEGTLVNALLYHLKDLSQIGGELKPGIVHRLDRGTSGVMVVAKTNEAHRELSRQFHDRTVEKTYLALAYGAFKQETGVMETSLGRSRGNRKKFSSRTRKGREAKTQWKVLRRLKGMTLVEVKPKTGRTHQIRVHFAESGHPIVGDPLYGGRQWIQKLSPHIQEAVCHLNRQALHAWRLRFRHPVSEKDLEFEAEIPEDLKKIVEAGEAS
jgi:23S rRNA pseudouridine1911/1915/1917 synthase